MPERTVLTAQLGERRRSDKLFEGEDTGAHDTLQIAFAEQLESFLELGFANRNPCANGFFIPLAPVSGSISSFLTTKNSGLCRRMC